MVVLRGTLADAAGADIDANGVSDNCECLGDVSLDGNVDGVDLGQLLSRWGVCGN